MAQAQKLVGTASMERVAGYVGNMAAFAPEAVDKLDIDAAIDEYANMHGVPPSVIRSKDDVDSIRAQRAQAAQQQQMAEQMPALNQAASAAKTLSETDIEETSALTRLLGGA